MKGVGIVKRAGTVKGVGDLIEIGDEYDAIRQRVSSMQVDGNDVQEAGAGDSVGIKLNYKVSEGRDVFRMG